MKNYLLIAAPLAFALAATPAAVVAQDRGGMFAKMDGNGDGKLDKAEITKMFEARAAKRGEGATVDPKRVDAFIARADQNGDAMIDAAELKAFRDARAAREGGKE